MELSKVQSPETKDFTVKNDEGSNISKDRRSEKTTNRHHHFYRSLIAFPKTKIKKPLYAPLKIGCLGFLSFKNYVLLQGNLFSPFQIQIFSDPSFSLFVLSLQLTVNVPNQFCR